MSFVFKENFTVSLPVLESGSPFGDFTESVNNAGIIVEIAAIHAGYTENNTFYSAEELKKAVASWVSPYPKPVIMNHDVTTEPVGRVVGAKMDMEENGKEFIRIQAAITDPKAIEKVMDKRYMTGSIGGKADVALCSVCGTDWAAKEAAQGIACKHQRGKVYEGTIAALKLGDLSFKEYSFVNVPADSESYVRSVQTPEGGTEADESWVKPSKFFIFSLNDRKVTEYSKDDEKSSFLIGESETQFLYDIIDLDNKNHKSLFVNNDSSVNTNENVQSLLLQETNMQNQEAETDQEDILAIAEQLSEDLSVDQAEAEVEAPVEEGEDNTDETVTEDSDTESDDTDESTDETETEVTDETAEAPEATEETEVEATDEEAPTDETEEAPTDKVEEESETQEEEEPEAGLVTEDSVEPELDSLKEEVASLKEENAGLKKALHRTLAERVVDTKISLGIEESTNRSVSIDEHSNRSASSLADSLRDLAKMPPTTRQSVAAENLNMVVESAAVGDEGDSAVTLTESEVKEQEVVSPKTIFVEKMAEILSGKTQLH